MKEIGGYFGLELRQGKHYHENAIKLNTARNCLEYILRVKKYNKIYIPYYTCEVILEPIKKCKIDYEFYHIDAKLEPVKKYELLDNEAFLYTNYFGLKQDAVILLSHFYGTNLIVDNSQAFYAEPVKGIDTFYSARKFFGVPDGAYLYTNKYLEEEIELDVSYTRMSHLLKRIDIGAEAGFSDFQENDGSLVNHPMKKMSNTTDKLLMSIDYENIKKIRRQNYIFLHENLKHKNKLDIALNEDAVPMVYQFFSEQLGLKQTLIQNKIFVATYWNNVLELCKSDSLECDLVERLLPLPIDQRYGETEMKIILNLMENRLWKKS